VVVQAPRVGAQGPRRVPARRWWQAQLPNPRGRGVNCVGPRPGRRDRPGGDALAPSSGPRVRRASLTISRASPHRRWPVGARWGLGAAGDPQAPPYRAGTETPTLHPCGGGGPAEKPQRGWILYVCHGATPLLSVPKRRHLTATLCGGAGGGSGQRWWGWRRPDPIVLSYGPKPRCRQRMMLLPVLDCWAGRPVVWQACPNPYRRHIAETSAAAVLFPKRRCRVVKQQGDELFAPRNHRLQTPRLVLLVACLDLAL